MIVHPPIPPKKVKRTHYQLWFVSPSESFIFDTQKYATVVDWLRNPVNLWSPGPLTRTNDAGEVMHARSAHIPFPPGWIPGAYR